MEILFFVYIDKTVDHVRTGDGRIHCNVIQIWFML